MHIRAATPDDGPVLVQALVDAANWSPDRPARGVDAVMADDHLARYVAGWPRPGDLGVVAETDGAAVGAAWLRCLPAEAPGYGFVADDIAELSIGVREGERGKGVGTALITALLDQAQARGVARVSLSVELRNPARRLYERCGFKTVTADGGAATMVVELGGRPVHTS